MNQAPGNKTFVVPFFYGWRKKRILRRGLERIYAVFFIACLGVFFPLFLSSCWFLLEIRKCTERPFALILFRWLLKTRLFILQLDRMAAEMASPYKMSEKNHSTIFLFMAHSIHMSSGYSNRIINHQKIVLNQLIFINVGFTWLSIYCRFYSWGNSLVYKQSHYDS